MLSMSDAYVLRYLYGDVQEQVEAQTVSSLCCLLLRRVRSFITRYYRASHTS